MKWLMIVMILALSACGLTDEPKSFEGPECGSVCGPCGLGKWDCDDSTCSVSFEGLDEDAICKGEDAQVVFVYGRSKNGDGSREKPFDTIEKAFERKNVSMVLVAGYYSYEGPLILKDGVSIDGGWTPEFESMPWMKATIRTEQSTNGHSFGVIAKDLKKTTVLSRLNIRNFNDVGSNAGIYSKNNLDLRLVDVDVDSGSGQYGRLGENGIDGVQGEDGQSGGLNYQWLGGAGGINSSCPEANGGHGGDGERRAGSIWIGVQRGAPSFLGYTYAQPGKRGADGQNGLNGSNGLDAKPGQLNEFGLWHYPFLATAGAPGDTGVGGGGGGGVALNNGDGIGGGGGGGAAGGCGGSGGQPGSNGWPSFGILSIDSQLTVRRSLIQADDGGRAGRGGRGGHGGYGGRGGLYARSSDQNGFSGLGGQGGRGGQGGHAGHAQHGISVGIYCKNSVVRGLYSSTITTGLSGGLEPTERVLGDQTVGCQMW